MSKPEHDRTIDYIEFGATDIETTKRFYAACFGWKFTDYGPDYVAFEDGRLTGGFTTESKPGGAPLSLSRSERQRAGSMGRVGTTVGERSGRAALRLPQLPPRPPQYAAGLRAGISR